MKIELEVADKEDKYSVIIDGNCIGYTYIWQNLEEKAYDIHVDIHKLNTIFEYKICELDKSIDSLQLPFELKNNNIFDWVEGSKKLTITSKGYLDESPSVFIQVRADTHNWEKPFSFIKMVNKLEKLCEEHELLSFYPKDNDDVIYNGFGIQQKITDTKLKVHDIYDEALNNFITIFTSVITSLLFETRQNSLTSIFNFPEDIQVSCEQYLVYFSQFLEDLGINAKTTIETEAQSTLFTVTPVDPSQALSQIRDALNIYLSLPEISDVELISNNYTDIGVQQLISNIYHLKSQLTLAYSIIQIKDSVIENLKFTSYSQKILLESDNKDEADEEQILNGLITIGEYKGNGFKINLPEVFRRIKRKFK